MYEGKKKTAIFLLVNFSKLSLVVVLVVLQANCEVIAGETNELCKSLGKAMHDPSSCLA